MIEIRNLHVHYQTDEGTVHAVRGIDITVQEGEFYTLLGPSGCGKTTTLRCIAGLETQSEMKGVIIATGGHSSNVEFRRMFDPRLTEEYQVAGEPWTKQTADGEILAMAIGATLWATGNQTAERGAAIDKTQHIGCRYGYRSLQWLPGGPMFARAGA